MPDRLPKVGEPLSIRAQDWRDLLASLAAKRGLPNSPSSPGAAVQQLAHAFAVRLTNDTADAVTAWGVVGLDDSEIDADAQPFESNKTPVISAVSPTQYQPFAIAQEPIASGSTSLFTAVVHGVTVANVDVTDTAHKFADVTTGDLTKLTSARNGPVRLLATPGGTGEQLITVFVDQTSQDPDAPDDLDILLVTKVCLSGLADLVVPDGDYGYPLDTDESGSTQTTTNTQDGFELTVERRTLTLPGSTGIGPPVCLTNMSDCCEAPFPDPPEYPPDPIGDDPPSCCGTIPSPTLNLLIEHVSGGWLCFDTSTVTMTKPADALEWYGRTTGILCPENDITLGSCQVELSFLLACVGNAWKIGYSTATAISFGTGFVTADSVNCPEDVGGFELVFNAVSASYFGAGYSPAICVEETAPVLKFTVTEL